MSGAVSTAPARSTVPAATRPPVRALQQWWVLTVRMIIPTLRNGELATQIAGSIVFTIGYYLPLKQMMGAVQPLSSYAQYLTPLIILQAIWFAAVSAAFRSATDSVQGINRRFRAMPIPAIMPLASRLTASMYRCVIALVVSVACGHVIGFRFHGSVRLGFSSFDVTNDDAVKCRFIVARTNHQPTAGPSMKPPPKPLFRRNKNDSSNAVNANPNCELSNR